MSLRAFHIFFVIVAEALILGFASWTLAPGADPEFRTLGITALVLAPLLAIYGVVVYRKLRRMKEKP